MKKQFLRIACVLFALSMLFASVSCSKNDQDDQKPTQGIINEEERTYKNESMEIVLQLDDEWSIHPTSELEKLAGMIANADEFAEAVEKLDVVYELYSVKNTSNCNIIIYFQNAKKSFGRALTEAELINATKDSSKETLEKNGSTVEKFEVVSKTIAGKQFEGFFIKQSQNGITLYQYSVFKRIGHHLYNITITAQNEAELDKTLSCFTKL